MLGQAILLISTLMLLMLNVDFQEFISFCAQDYKQLFKVVILCPKSCV